jgi:hypothetical protein
MKQTFLKRYFVTETTSIIGLKTEGAKADLIEDLISWVKVKKWTKKMYIS